MYIMNNIQVFDHHSIEMNKYPFLERTDTNEKKALR